MFQVISEKTLCNRGFTGNLFEKYFYIKIIVTVTPANLDTNLLLFFFCPFVELKEKVKFSAGCWSGNEK